MWLFLSLSLSGPVFPVEVPVADGFSEVVGAYLFTAFQVGDGAGHFQYAVVGTGREVEAFHGIFQQCQSLCVGAGVAVQQPATHLGIAMNVAFIGISQFLYFPGSDDSFPDGGA